MSAGSLNRARREALVARMAEREADLRAQVAERRAALESPAPAGDPAGDDADLAFARTRAGIDYELIDRYLAEIAAIEQARARIESGAYGTCVECGLEIGWARLQANPAALRCADCQDLHEKSLAVSAQALRAR